MTEYINRKDAINGFVKMLKQSGDIYPTDITTMLQSIPPADVRPVVRCRDCRYSMEPDRHSMAENAACEGVLICFVGYDHVYPSISNDIFVDGEHFCGFGEVRDD